MMMIKYWDLRQPNPTHVQALPERCYALTVRHPLMVVTTADRNLIVYNLQNPQTEFKRISSPLKYQTRCVAASPYQQGFLVGSIEGRVGVHHLDESQKSKNFTFKCHREGNDNALNFHPVHHTLTTAGSDVLLTFGIKIANRGLRHLTKRPRKKIQELASILLGLWKNIIVEQAITNIKNGNSDKKDFVKSVETSESIKVQKGNSVKVGEFCKGETVKLERSNSSTTRKLENVVNSETSSSAKRAKGVDGVKLKNKSDVESIRVEEKVKKEVSGTSDVRKPATNAVAMPKMSSVVLCKDPSHDKIRELLSEALLKVYGEISEDQGKKRMKYTLTDLLFRWSVHCMRIGENLMDDRRSSTDQSYSI